MNESQWNSFLVEYNRELLSYEEVVEALPRELIKKGLLGYRREVSLSVEELANVYAAYAIEDGRAFVERTCG